MKKLFFVTLVALALTACSFEMPELNIPTPDESQDITADNGDFTAAIGKTYTWTEAHVFLIFDSSQTAEDEKSLSIIKTEDGMLELVSFENKTASIAAFIFSTAITLPPFRILSYTQLHFRRCLQFVCVCL